MKKLIVAIMLISSTASAAKLEDVQVLKMTPGPENFELKLQAKGGPKDSYFLVDITRSDVDSFKKLTHVIRKLVLKEKYKLDLDIPSFSISPSGSYYRSEGISISGSEVEKK